MDALGQRIEVEARRPGDDDLTVEDDALGELVTECVDELGEVSSQRLLVAAA